MNEQSNEQIAFVQRRHYDIFSNFAHQQKCVRRSDSITSIACVMNSRTF